MPRSGKELERRISIASTHPQPNEGTVTAWLSRRVRSFPDTVLKRWAVVGLVLATLLGQALVRPECMAAARNSQEAEADALFTNASLHVLRIDIPRGGWQSLRQEPRTFVRATLHEGPTVYTNVLVRLKGGAGSFR